MAMADRRDVSKGVVKKELKEHKEKLDGLESRLARAEAIQERQEAYRRIRVEKCPALGHLWTGVESKEVPAGEFRTLS